MGMFDPKKAREENKNNGIPAGPYLLAMRAFDRKTSKAGKPYLHCRFVVIAGPAKKRVFFDNMSIDERNTGAMGRLGIYAEQCGVEEAFDLSDDGAIEANFVGRPFKAMVSRKEENGYVNNGISRFLTGDQVTDDDRRKMDEWVTEEAERAEWAGGGGPDVPPPGDDDFVPNGADDDIPF